MAITSTLYETRVQCLQATNRTGTNEIGRSRIRQLFEGEIDCDRYSKDDIDGNRYNKENQLYTLFAIITWYKALRNGPSFYSKFINLFYYKILFRFM